MKTKALPIEKLEADQMFLHQRVGEGEYKGHEFEFGVALPAHSPMLSYKGERYMLKMNDILLAMLEAAEEDKIT